MDEWIFGYGSLIWKPDLPYLERRTVWLKGWARRFWQGSHDHRGVPDAPGRVVTLTPQPGEACAGVAYRLPGGELERLFGQLDHREKNGYARHRVALEPAGGTPFEGVVYIATEHNEAFLGPAPVSAMARHIAASRGPSGTNSEYLLRLAEALRVLGIEDPHVFELEAAVRALEGTVKGSAEQFERL